MANRKTVIFENNIDVHIEGNGTFKVNDSIIFTCPTDLIEYMYDKAGRIITYERLHHVLEHDYATDLYDAILLADIPIVYTEKNEIIAYLGLHCDIKTDKMYDHKDVNLMEVASLDMLHMINFGDDNIYDVMRDIDIFIDSYDMYNHVINIIENGDINFGPSTFDMNDFNTYNVIIDPQGEGMETNEAMFNGVMLYLLTDGDINDDAMMSVKEGPYSDYYKGDWCVNYTQINIINALEIECIGNISFKGCNNIGELLSNSMPLFGKIQIYGVEMIINYLLRYDGMYSNFN